MTPCPGRWASATGANDDGGEDMKPATGCIIAATLALAFAVPSAAVEVDNLDAFKQHFCRYAPGGDCGKQPQIVVRHSGLAFEGGQALLAGSEGRRVGKECVRQCRSRGVTSHSKKTEQ